MAIYGYSERGIINSLIFAIGDDNKLMKEFINELKIPKPFELDEPDNYEILLEQSFSEFGDADLVIIIHYKGHIKNKVLFIEGKVKTSQSNHWNIINQLKKFENNEIYNGYSSNLFFQLHLKKLLADKWDDIKTKGGAFEPRLKKTRKIGENEIVKKAFNKVKDCQAYYIGLIPTTVDDIKAFTENIEYKDITEDTVKIVKSIHYVSWETVKIFCEVFKLENVKLNFVYNDKQIFNEESRIKDSSFD